MGVAHFNGVGDGANCLFFQRSSTSVPELSTTDNPIVADRTVAITSLVIDANSELPEIQRHQAELLLLEGDFAAANAAATASLAGARDLGMTLEEGMTLRVLGTAQTRMGANADAAASFAASVALLDERSPYDAARTRLAWARMLLATGATAEAETQLVRAHAWLHKLGAQREMNELLHLLT